MELVERYIYAVTQKLPQTQREDISKELRSLIEDMVEERASGGEIQEKHVEEVLLELGNPEELAQNYCGKRKYVIGPVLFDFYMLVLKISLISFAAAMGVVFVIQIIMDPIAILDHFIGLIVSIVTVVPQIVGWVTIGFAIGEYFGGLKADDLSRGEAWKPSKLQAIPDPKGRIKRSDPITGIIFYSIFMMILVFNNEYFGIWFFSEREFQDVIPFLNPETYTCYLLFILAIFGFGIIKECLKLVYGKWTIKLVIFTAIVNIVSLFIIVVMVSGPEFWNPDFMSQLVQHEFFTEGSETYSIAQKIWEQSTFWILILLVIGLIWDIIDGTMKAFKNR